MRTTGNLVFNPKTACGAGEAEKALFLAGLQPNGQQAIRIRIP